MTRENKTGRTERQACPNMGVNHDGYFGIYTTVKSNHTISNSSTFALKLTADAPADTRYLFTDT